MNRSPRKPRISSDRYVRSPALVVYWQSSTLVALDCTRGTRAAVDADVIGIVDALHDWTTAADLVARHPELGSARAVGQLLEALAESGLLIREGDAVDTSWHQWAPEAAFFHFGTRDRRYRDDPSHDAYDATLRGKAKQIPPPPPTKVVSGPTIELSKLRVPGSLSEALVNRRTWRRFGNRAVPQAALATLLGQTFGVQRRGVVPGQGQIVLKTSPSGGARHSIEAYVVALRVEGVEKGVYHYDAARHCLVRLDGPAPSDALAAALAHQRYFVRAGALVVMTAVFERAMWRYPFSRAYRSILTEAGHLGQTFCLAATALQLAPFCTMAFRESALERLLGVDGVSESAMYVVGVGCRPAGRVTHPGRIPQGSRS